MSLKEQTSTNSGLADYFTMLGGDGTGLVCIAFTDQPHFKSLRPKFFPANDVAAMVDYIDSFGKQKLQVVAGFARLAKAPVSGRGTSTDVSAFSVIGMDIDVATPKSPIKLYLRH